MACKAALRTSILGNARSSFGSAGCFLNPWSRLSGVDIPRAQRSLPIAGTCPRLPIARGMKTTAPVRYAAKTSDSEREEEASRQQFVEGMLVMLEDRAVTCIDSRLALLTLDRDPTPAKYFAGIVNNMRLMEAVLKMIDFHEFRDSEVEEGSVIARVREAYMAYSRIHAEWMENALTDMATNGEADPELLELFQYFRMNVKLIDLYLQGDAAPPPRPAWADICDAIILLCNWSGGPLGKAAGGVGLE